MTHVSRRATRNNSPRPIHRRSFALFVQSILALSVCTAPVNAADNLDQQLDASASFTASVDVLPSASQPFLTNLKTTQEEKPFKFTLAADGTYNSNLLMRSDDPTQAASTAPKFAVEWARDVWTITAAYQAGRSSDLSELYDTDLVNAGISLKLPSVAEHLAGFIPVLGYSFSDVQTAFFEGERAKFHDFFARFIRQWGKQGDPRTAQLTLTTMRRLADPVASERTLVGSEFVLTQLVAQQTKLGLTLTALQAWYDEGSNDGRSDQTLRAKLELRYDFEMPEDHTLAVSLAAQFTQNYSNFAFARTNGWLIGPVLTWSAKS